MGKLKVINQDKHRLMNINSGYGDLVSFTGRNGHDWQQEKARKYFYIGQVLRVAYVEVNQSSSTVYFLEHPDIGFNTVMFRDVKPYYLIKYSDNWADEMYIDGHTVIDLEKFHLLNQALKKVSYMKFSIGTNEEIEYNGNLEEPLEVLAITGYQYRTMKNMGIDNVGFAQYYIDDIFNKFKEIEEEEMREE